MAVSIRELHLRTGEIVDRAASGRSVQISRRGVAVAELRALPDEPARLTLPDRSKLLARFPALRSDSGRMLEEDRR